MSAVSPTATPRDEGAQGPRTLYAPSREHHGLARAAREFESLLTQRLVSTLRARPDGEEGPGGGMLDLMVDQALAGHLAKGRGMGIASVLYRRWTGEELPGSAVRLAGNAAGLRGGDASDPLAPQGGPSALPDVPALPWHDAPGGGVDDGVTPLRELMPPTGLDDDAGPAADARQEGSARPSDALAEKVLNGPTGGPDPTAGGSSWVAPPPEVRGVEHDRLTIDDTGTAGAGRSPEAREQQRLGAYRRGLGEYAGGASQGLAGGRA